MNHLLLFPPVWPPTSPHIAIPSLIAQLKKENFDAEAIDLNVEFYCDILKKNYLEKSIKQVKKIQEKSTEAENYDLTNKNIEEYPIDIQILILKNKAIKEFLEHKSPLLKTIPKEIENAVEILKNPEYFYKPNSFLNAYKIISSALKIISLPFAPAKISISEYENPLLELNYDSIKYNVFSESTNIFMDYYKKWIPIIKKKKPKYIGISIASDSQIVPGLTLAHLLKKHTSAHINIGGNLFSRIVDTIVQYPEFFDLYADSVSVDEGEKSIIELAKYLDNKIPIEKVPNLIYKKNNIIIINEKCTPSNLNEIEPPNFDDYNFSKYITPEIVLPLQTTRECYWGNCTFCDMTYGKGPGTKNIDNLIKELKEYKKKYNATHFMIVDESIHPEYYEKLADKIIENKLNISYQSYGRTEKLFNKDVLEKLSKSGLKMVLWGIESGSKRILKLINKGVDYEKRFEVLKEASNAGIWNHAFIMFGYPTETMRDAKETIDIIERNSDIINSIGKAEFGLAKHSKISENPERYGIKTIHKEKEDFSILLDFKSSGMTSEEIEEMKQLYTETINKKYDLALWKYFSSFQNLFLYISHYGSECVKNFKIEK